MSLVGIVGNLALDRIDGGPPQAGGCPVFAALALRLLGRSGQILTRCARADRSYFADALQVPGMPATTLPASRSAGFDHRYDGEIRTTTVTALGEPWTPADAAHLAPAVGWLHVAPLLRDDFPATTLAAMARGDRKLSLDGQGLVRRAALGPLTQDAAFDPAVLAAVSVLKLSQEEAQIVAHGAFSSAIARSLRVPEIVVTLGSLGAELYLDGELTRVPTTPVLGVQSTGAGDAFMVAFIASRSDGATPLDATHAATAVVVRMLRARKEGRGKHGGA
jgi:sugar/nucleoside kinase (ribokinase family)